MSWDRNDECCLEEFIIGLMLMDIRLRSAFVCNVRIQVFYVIQWLSVYVGYLDENITSGETHLLPQIISKFQHFTFHCNLSWLDIGGGPIDKKCYLRVHVLRESLYRISFKTWAYRAICHFFNMAQLIQNFNMLQWLVNNTNTSYWLNSNQSSYMDKNLIQQLHQLQMDIATPTKQNQWYSERKEIPKSQYYRWEMLWKSISIRLWESIYREMANGQIT